MNLIYNLGIYLYKQIVRLVSARNPKAKLMVKGHKTLFSDLESKIEKGEKYIWIHSSSLGEFEQGRPIIEKIKEKNSQEKILLTFFSPSGYTVRKDYPLADVVSYLPFDLPGNVRRFLDVVNPKMAIFIKYEFWGNFLNELHKRAIPTYLVISKIGLIILGNCMPIKLIKHSSTVIMVLKNIINLIFFC